ncbi:MAG TPA: hypothetical protein VGM41_08330 [Chitinophagaceae bacterium]|jgi:hypothetical protein
MRRTICVLLIALGLLFLYFIAVTINNLAASLYVAGVAIALGLMITKDPFIETEKEDQEAAA